MRLLNKIEQLVHLDLSYFLPNGFWLGVGQFGSLILSFVGSLVFARFLSAETYGIYRYLCSIISIISLLSLTGLGTALVQAVALGKQGTLRPAFAAQLRWSLLVSLLSFGLSFYALLQGNTIFFVTFLIFAIIAPLYFASGLYDQFLSGQSRFRLTTIYQFILNASTSFFLIVAAFFGPFFLILFPLQYVLQTVLCSFFYFRIVRTIPQNASIDEGAITYGKHLSLINVLAAIADQADNIIVFIFAGPVNLAIYSFAIAIPEIIKGLLKIITPLSLPKLAGTDPVIFRRTLPVRIFQIISVTSIVIFTYILAAPFIFNAFFPAYQNAVVYSQVFVFSLFVTPFYFINAFFQAKKMVKQILLTNTVFPIIQIILMIFFTYFWGLPGLIIARILGRFTNLFFSFFLIKNC